MTAAGKCGIAVLGFACRLPSAPDTDSFWKVLAEGRSVITQVSPERWALERYGHPDKSAIGRSYTWAAGQIDDVFGFDAAFFGISPREAVQMDPQQRLLLQVAWEAFESAGIPPSRLAGSETGVYVGASGLDYSNAIHLDPAIADTQMMTGNTLSIISNRLSYIFDFHGPSFTVDTACSSSLIALHEAMEALRSGRIETAVVGGVNLLLHPAPFVGFSRASMLSSDGLCRAFDANGSGYVRSEGAVVMVLKRADAAAAARDDVRALLVGSGINCDGRTVGLSLPSSAAQAALLAQVYERFEIDPADLAFVEAHGTGTRVGDPVEAEAIGKVLGRRRREPLLIGSVKTNFGHLEPASGLVGVMKAVLALENDLLPPSLHFETPNPDIAFEELNLRVAATATPLARTGRTRAAGVNSFGFGGANAHVVVREPEPVPAAEAPRFDAPLLLSAESQEALAALATRTAELLDGASAADARRHANAAAWRRERLRHRAVLTASDPAARTAALEALATGRAHADVIRGEALDRAGEVVFVYSGNGSQWAGMGRETYQRDRHFRLSFDRTDRCFMGVAGWSLLSMLFSEDLESEIERTEIAQPLLFAMQIALTDSLRRHGLQPAAAIGHSVGEVAAATVAGALTLEDGVQVIHARSTHQEVTRHLGGMAAVLLPAAEAAEAIAGYKGLDVAAINSPRSVTVSGPAEELDRFVADSRKRRLAVKRLDLDYPFHCALVDPIRQPLVAALQDIRPRASAIPFYSTVTGGILEGEALGTDYWWQNVRRPVDFVGALGALFGDGKRLFVEIGPRPVLTGYINDVARSGDTAVRVLGSLDATDGEHGDPVRRIAVASLANGAAVDDTLLFGPHQPGRMPLSSYPWQNQHYRFANTAEEIALLKPLRNRLLGWSLHAEAREWFNLVDVELFPWLADHRVEDTVVFPAAGYVEIFLAAGREVLGDCDIEISELEIYAPLVLEKGVSRQLKTICSEGGAVSIMSRARLSDSDWTPHARASVRRAPLLAAGAGEVAGEGRSVTADQLYQITEHFGLHYGPVFRRGHRVRVGGENAIEVQLSPADPATALLGFHLDPALLDSCFHGLFAFVEDAVEVPAGVSALPVRFGRVRLRHGAADPVRAAVAIGKVSDEIIEASFDLFAADGELIGTLERVRFQLVPLSRAADLDALCYRLVGKNLARRGDRSGFCDEAVPPLEAIVGSLALASAGEPELDEASLLLEVAVRRAAWEALAPLFVRQDSEATLPALVAANRFDRPQAALCARLLQALDQSGCATTDGEGNWRLAAECGLPDLSDIISTLVAEHPDRVSEIALASALPGALARCLSEPMPATCREVFADALLDHFVTLAPSSRPLSDAVLAVVASVQQAWPLEAPLRVLVAGAHSTAVIARLAELDFAQCSVTVADRDKAALDRGRLTVGARPGLAWRLVEEIETGDPDHTFDLLVSAGGLSPLTGEERAHLVRALAAGGAVVAAEPVPSLFRDAICGTGGAWWAATADPAFPVGALLSKDEWTEELAAAGVETPVAATLATDATDALLLTGRRAADTPAERPAEPRSGAVVFLTRQAGLPRAVCEAMAASLGTERPVLLLESGDAAAELGGGRWQIDLDTLAGAADANPADEAAMPGLPAAVLDPATRDIVIACGPDAVAGDPAGALAGHLARMGAFLLALGPSPRRLWVVTSGGQQLHGRDGADPAHAAVWGYFRVATNEFPHLEMRLVDIAAALAPGEAATRLLAEFERPNDEREIVLDTDRRSGLRLVRANIGARPLPASTGEGGARRLVVRQRGSIESLAWEPAERGPLAPNAVEIEVSASGLNFRDVMWTLGLLPHEALEAGFAGPTLGMECAGRIARVGANVTRFAPGELVVAFAPASFATHVAVSEAAVARLPEGVDPVAAATIPVAFLTAYYALVHLGQLQPGERVLIHGGAGGVGLAALQIAKWREAQVIATAGTPEKRSLLTHLGADLVFDSRTLAFADDIRRATGGEGVDVVLNSLAGEAMERSIDTLKPFGRFLELGKRDFYANTPLGLRPFRQNLSYFGIDADQLLLNKPALVERLFAELLELFEEGVLTPLPYRAFEAPAAGEAFRLMQQSGHIGKIVIVPSGRAPAPPLGAPVRIRPDATYLVAGGTRGFGFATARWLAASGARSLVLASRTGTLESGLEAEVEALARDGVAVRVEAVDVTDAAAIQRLVAAIDRPEAPLKGVFHTAMVLDDGLIASLDAARIENVLRPKVRGAEILDSATAHLPLDLFVMFSSVTTMIGNPGQANYVAANAWLEALARRRRAQGKPALAIAWGAIEDVGVLARNASVSELLSRKLGRHAMTAADALKGLAWLLESGAASGGEPVYAFGRVDWAAAAKDLAIMKTPLFGEIGFEAGATDGAGIVDLAAELEGLSNAEALQKVAALLAGEMSRILKLPADQIDKHRPLAAIGMDSLMALELKMAAEQRLGIEIPLMSLASGATLSDIARRVVGRMRGEEAASGIDETSEALAKSHIGEEGLLADRGAMTSLKDAVEERAGQIRNIL